MVTAKTINRIHTKSYIVDFCLKYLLKMKILLKNVKYLKATVKQTLGEIVNGDIGFLIKSFLCQKLFYDNMMH